MSGAMTACPCACRNGTTLYHALESYHSPWITTIGIALPADGVAQPASTAMADPMKERRPGLTASLRLADLPDLFKRDARAAEYLGHGTEHRELALHALDRCRIGVGLEIDVKRQLGKRQVNFLLKLHAATIE